MIDSCKNSQEIKDFPEILIKEVRSIRIIFENNFNILYISENIEAFLGFINEEIIGKNIIDFLYPEDSDNFLKLYQDFIENKINNGEFRIRCKNGSYKWVEFKSYVSTKRSNNIKILLILSDITERKLLENNFKQQNIELELLNKIIFYANTKQDITEFLRSTMNLILSLLNFDCGSIYQIDDTRKSANFTYFQGFPFEYIEELKSVKISNPPYDTIFIKGLPIFDDDTLILDQKAAERWGFLSMTWIPLISYNNKIIGAYVLSSKKRHFFSKNEKNTLQTLGYEIGKTLDRIQDMIEISSFKESLLKAEKKCRELIEATPIGLLEIDLFNKKVEYINPELYRIIGFTKEELSNDENFFNIVLPKNVKIDKESHQSSEINYEIVDKKKNLKYLTGKRILIRNEKGEPTILRLWLLDITDKKKADEIINNEIIKLKDLDKIKTEFVYRASHEFKTPLTLVCSSSELLTTYYSDLLDDRAESLIKIIYKGGTRLKNLVNELLDVSRLEAGKMELKKENVNLVDLITDCVNSTIYMLKERDLNLFFNLKEEINLNIDKIKIEQVFINILSNAIKNTTPKGDIFINISFSGEYVNINFKDTGIGLTSEEINKLFQKFGKIERYGQGMEISTEGSGLGLYISKEIVELHGGKILVESEGRNKGAIFTVKLPID